MIHTRLIAAAPLVGCIALLALGSAQAQVGQDDRRHQVLGPSLGDIRLTEQQRSMVELAKASKATSAVSVMASPAASPLGNALTDGSGGTAAGGRITLALSDSTVLTAVPTSVEVRPEMGVWRGAIEGDGGLVTILWWPDGQMAGTVQHGRNFYSIRPMGERLHAVVEMREDQMPPEHAPLMLVSGDDSLQRPGGTSTLQPVTGGMRAPTPQRLGVPGKPALPSAARGARGATAQAGATIDVIVAYTRKSAGYYGDVKRELVDVAVEEANESFRLSNLGNVKLRVVHAYQTDYVEEGSHFDHVWRMADKGDGYLEEVHGLREKYRADVVVLIVDDPQGCGLATRVHADADESFAVVHHECAATTYSLAHEIGHIIGARHEPNMDKISTPFPYGHGYVNGTKWRDIMSYKESCGGCPRLPVWSSPTVLVRGEPAGTEDLNNARVIAEQAVRVASFR